MKHRIFIAINLPLELKQEIKIIQAKLNKFDWPVRWEPPEKWHLTLRFLGYITEEELGKVQSIIKRSITDIKPFNLSLNNFIVFPSLKFPRVICLKIDDSEPLHKFQKAIAKAIARENIGEYERYPFSAHITIGRAKPIKANFRALTKMEFSGQFEVKSVEIMQSILKPAGSVYSVVESFNF